MKVSWRWKWVVAAFCALGVQGEAAADAPRVIRLTSAEWPPYTSQTLRQQGVTTAVIRAAFAAVGCQLAVDFYPWRRAIALAEREARYAGYFPEYAAQSADGHFLLSESVGDGPLGFAERKDAPVQWQRLDELGPLRIGVVQGYLNTDDLDRRIGDGLQKVDEARDDAQNLLKLAAGRVRLAVIDRRVFQYLVHADPRVMSFAGELRFNSRLLEDKGLYVAFRNTEEGREARRLLNEGLKKIDVKAVVEAALR
ncbi:transporter substrate-binding domain-containing protein [Oxalobacteraceae bacterium OM1]|nr:transporter substrate-binding domain-containing protein [Oxalobacteraceae bacterium OM1]